MYDAVAEGMIAATREPGAQWTPEMTEASTGALTAVAAMMLAGAAESAA